MTTLECTGLHPHASSRVGVEKGIAERLAEWKASGEATGKELREIFLDIRTAGLEAKELLALEDDVDACFDKVKWTKDASTDEKMLFVLYRALKETCHTIRVQHRLSFGFGVEPIKKLPPLGDVHEVELCEPSHTLNIGSVAFDSYIIGDHEVGCVIPKGVRPPTIIPIRDICLNRTTFLWLYRKMRTFFEGESRKGFFLRCPIEDALVFDFDRESVHWASDDAFGAFGDRAELTPDSHIDMVRAGYAVASFEYFFWELLRHATKFVMKESVKDCIANISEEPRSAKQVCEDLYDMARHHDPDESIGAVFREIRQGIKANYRFYTMQPSPFKTALERDLKQAEKEAFKVLEAKEEVAKIVCKAADFGRLVKVYPRSSRFKKVRPRSIEAVSVAAASTFTEKLAYLHHVARLTNRSMPRVVRPLLPPESSTIKEKVGEGTYGRVYKLENGMMRKIFRRSVSWDEIGEEYAATRAVAGLVLSTPNVGPLTHFPVEGIGFDMEPVESKSFTLDSAIQTGRDIAGMHERGAVHNDLYYRNVVGDHAIDFGFMTALGEATTLGQHQFMPPEGCLFKLFLKKKFPTSCFLDSWSFGALLYMHWTEKLFVASENVMEQLVLFCSKTAAARREALYDAIVEEGGKDAKADILFKLLHPNPSERMLVKEAVAALEALKEAEVSIPKEGAAGGGGGEG